MELLHIGLSAGYDRRGTSVEEHPIRLRQSLARAVPVRRISDLAEAHAAVLEAASKGAAVALIRNTVDEAVASHGELASAFDGEMLLFHARFAMADRLAIEERVLEKFGRAPKIARPGILVATQVIEQSLDLDFDLIATDLAPIDLLIQRAGRLWRHMDQRPESARPRISEPSGPTLLVLSAEPLADAGARWLDSVLSKTTAVYRDAALLWRSAKVMFDAGRIVSRTSPECAAPESGELRALVEAAYGKNRIAIPGGLEGAQNEAAGKASAERSQGGFNVLRYEAGYDFDGGRWDADSRVPTRIGDDTISVRLAVLQEGRILPWALREGSERADRRAWALSEVSVRRSRCSDTVAMDLPISLLSVKWIPTNRTDGSRDHIAPYEITSDHDSNPIGSFAWPRPDFDLAAHEFLIGLFAVAFPPKGQRDWLLHFHAPPAPEVLGRPSSLTPPHFRLMARDRAFCRNFRRSKGSRRRSKRCSSRRRVRIR